MQVSLNKALNEGQEKDEELARLTGIIEDNTNTIADYEQKAREFETDRRKLHNTIQELKVGIDLMRMYIHITCVTIFLNPFSAKGNIEVFADNTDSGESACDELSHLKSALFAF